MKTKYHVCIDVEESIKHPLSLRGCITTENGNVLNSSDEVREFLKEQLAQGKKYLPCGDCDNFDYQQGCKGHETVSLEQAQNVVFNVSKRVLSEQEKSRNAYSIAEIYKARCESLEETIMELKRKLAKAEHDRDRYKARIDNNEVKRNDSIQ